ncbi:MAG TPA: sigma 54-interacting transcriptional regulator [Polyangiaceae bacterium]|nr:sigma 54-interacting transcriptional regulator [Polyangiaceae bacterium]
MPRDDETSEDSLRAPVHRMASEPGVVVIFAAGRPAAVPLKIGAGGLEIGRGTPAGMLEDDDRISRKHVQLRRTDGGWSITDLESRNGTFVEGKQLTSSSAFPSPTLVRIGRSLCWAVDDVLPFFGDAPSGSRLEGPILGGRMRRVWGEIALAGRAGDTLYLRGESGSGKELAARAYHEAHFGAVSSAPFVAVNCAAVPEGLAERLLFGARKGAYSGATADAEGYVQAADGGTLFLDEIAELDPQVQAKLLRVLETREVLPLGAARSRKVEIRICAASHKSLRDEVRAGRFREDLYFRIGRPEVVVPPLRERLDEIPWLVARDLLAVDARLGASVTLIESCALAAWPGNVRELLREIRRAAHRALEEGVTVVQPHHLAAEAGAPLGPSISGPPADGGKGSAGGQTSAPPAAKSATAWSDEQIIKALADNAGNVRGTARALGMHRNQLRRWLEKHPEVTADPNDPSSPSDDS